MILYRKTIPDYKKVNKSNFIGGILIPLLFAFFFGQTLIDIFPGLTLIDLGAYLIIGMVSGFFIALFIVSKNNK